MDHSFLVYRLRGGSKRHLTLQAKTLQAVSGGGRGLLKNFRPEFKAALAEARKYYPEFETILRASQGHVESPFSHSIVMSETESASSVQPIGREVTRV